MKHLAGIFMRRHRAERTVLIVEPNPYHGELLPGFTYLFQRLGFRVELLVRKEVLAERPFDRYPKGLMPKINIYRINDLKSILKRTSKRYDRLFFSTNVLWERDYNESGIVEYLGFEPLGKKPSLYIEHNLTYIDKDQARGMLDQGRLFTLLPYQLDGVATKMLNPNYFGTFTTSPNPGVTQLCLMGSSSRDQNNLNKLFGAIRQIKDENISNLIITVIGFEIDVPVELKSYFNIVGRVDFPEYFKIVERSHYLLTLIDLESQDIIHSKYSQGTTSGTVQTSLGFNRPMIIDSKHSTAYGFDKVNAVVYEPDELTDAIRRVVTATSVEYSNMQTNLRARKEKIELESLANLSMALDEHGASAGNLIV